MKRARVDPIAILAEDERPAGEVVAMVRVDDLGFRQCPKFIEPLEIPWVGWEDSVGPAIEFWREDVEKVS
jgi:hypothetical protein